VCKDIGLSIPRDVKVIAISNLQTASILAPSLTTISQPAKDIGREAASVLVTALNRNQFELENRKIILPSVLIERDSTKSFPSSEKKSASH
jgi:LacI family transcriptional regulator